MTAMLAGCRTRKRLDYYLDIATKIIDNVNNVN
jgi:hypothetical protein